MLYMVTSTINIPHMLAYILYMNPMGNDNVQGFLADPLTSQTSRTNLLLGLPDHFFCLDLLFLVSPSVPSTKLPENCMCPLCSVFGLSVFVLIRPSDCLALQCIDCVLLSKLFVFRRKCKLFLKNRTFKQKASH